MDNFLRKNKKFMKEIADACFVSYMLRDLEYIKSIKLANKDIELNYFRDGSFPLYGSLWIELIVKGYKLLEFKTEREYAKSVVEFISKCTYDNDYKIDKESVNDYTNLFLALKKSKVIIDKIEASYFNIPDWVKDEIHNFYLMCTFNHDFKKECIQSFLDDRTQTNITNTAVMRSVLLSISEYLKSYTDEFSSCYTDLVENDCYDFLAKKLLPRIDYQVHDYVLRRIIKDNSENLKRGEL